MNSTRRSHSKTSDIYDYWLLKFCSVDIQMLQLALRQQQLQAAQMQLKLQHQSQLVHRRQHQYQQQNHLQPSTQTQTQYTQSAESNASDVSSVSDVNRIVSSTPSDVIEWASPVVHRDDRIPGRKAHNEQVDLANRNTSMTNLPFASNNPSDTGTVLNSESRTSSPQAHVSN
jgi:hypothetical protein